MYLKIFIKIAVLIGRIPFALNKVILGCKIKGIKVKKLATVKTISYI
jgi:hypothetical protein